MARTGGPSAVRRYCHPGTGPRCRPPAIQSAAMIQAPVAAARHPKAQTTGEPLRRSAQDPRPTGSARRGRIDIGGRLKRSMARSGSLSRPPWLDHGAWTGQVTHAATSPAVAAAKEYISARARARGDRVVAARRRARTRSSERASAATSLPRTPRRLAGVMRSGASHAIADHTGQPRGERLVHHQAPRLSPVVGSARQSAAAYARPSCV